MILFQRKRAQNCFILELGFKHLLCLDCKMTAFNLGWVGWGGEFQTLFLRSEEQTGVTKDTKMVGIRLVYVL